MVQESMAAEMEVLHTFDIDRLEFLVNGEILAAPFDQEALELTGPAGGAGRSAVVLHFTPANWKAAQQVEIRAIDDSDTVPEGLRKVAISHSVISNDANFSGLALPDVDRLVDRQRRWDAWMSVESPDLLVALRLQAVVHERLDLDSVKQRMKE